MEVGRGANNPTSKNLHILRTVQKKKPQTLDKPLEVDNGKMDQEIGRWVVEWIDLAKDRVKRRALVNTVTKFHDP